ncbi:MAG TPA: NAD(P)H-dependent oxidoreductase [Pedobacter sp.]|jgi:chromate reductase
MEKQLIFAGISGSLRKGSYNTLLLDEVQSLLPDGVTMNILSIADLPHYNSDFDLPSVDSRPKEVNISESSWLTPMQLLLPVRNIIILFPGH